MLNPIDYLMMAASMVSAPTHYRFPRGAISRGPGFNRLSQQGRRQRARRAR